MNYCHRKLHHRCLAGPLISLYINIKKHKHKHKHNTSALIIWKVWAGRKICYNENFIKLFKNCHECAPNGFVIFQFYIGILNFVPQLILPLMIHNTFSSIKYDIIYIYIYIMRMFPKF